MKPIPPIFDQGNLDACQSFAVSQLLLTLKGINYSPVELYNEATAYNKGRTPSIDDVCSLLKEKGIIYGHDHQKIGTQENMVFVKEELIQKYTNKQQIIYCRNVIKFFGGGIMTVTVPDGEDIAPTGILSLDDLTKNKTRTHATFLYDYDDKKELFTLINSWGYSYGDHSGCLYVPYSLVEKSLNCISLSVVKK